MISHGFNYQSLTKVDFPTLMKIFNREDGERIFIKDARNDPRIPNLERLGKMRVGSVTGMFFEIVDSYTGLLAVYFTNYRQLGKGEEELVTALGEQASIALQRALRYDEEMLGILGQMVEGLVLTIEAKDEVTHGHSVRVARFARMVAYEMELSPRARDTVFHAALLHDIGKIAMTDSLLLRLGTLSGSEMDQVKQHPLVGAKILGPLPFLNEISTLILHHHERYDGSGYPHGIKGEDIPLGARILAVCDAFETMLSGRPSMDKVSLPQAVRNLQKGAGTLFDSKVVQALFRVMEKHPDQMDAGDDLDFCLDLLQKDVEGIARTNRVRKKMAGDLFLAF
ncbi:MAG: hypothetical protein B6230_08055 [Desulfobacteraceae bacterium 4572_89]|nr:MAG: hypothetical protein B6230_08055 [Desulfobacteraceae bacterium 4572_89]